ncbi:MAG: hypothetical protein ABI625_01865 [bacterium]
MAAIRVMLGTMPAMVRGILEETFATQHDMMLVGNANADVAMSATVAAHNPDILVVGMAHDEWASEFISLFIDHPRLHILAIGEDARAAMIQELYIRRWRISELSPMAIVDAVRASCAVENASARPISNTGS